MGYLIDETLKKPVLEDVAVTILPEANYAIECTPVLDSRQSYVLYDNLGIADQCFDVGIKSSESELVIGIDLGTSKTKVVVGDKQLDKSYAVSFKNTLGVDSYLLSTSIYVDRGSYSLLKGNVNHSDLKVKILSAPNDLDCRINLIAFLSLIIRHVRGWIFKHYSDQYIDKEIFWTISLGIPTVNQDDQSMVELYEYLANVAWCVANKNKVVSRQLVKDVIEKVSRRQIINNDLEVKVVPELAAQIYGFVISSSFDIKAKNIYMMFDIGGGSLDSAIFYVKPTKGTQWRFSYFNAQVKPLGVINLHKYRLSFWKDLLSKVSGSKALRKQLCRDFVNLNSEGYIPTSFSDYFVGITLEIPNTKVSDPDVLFKREICNQVRGETLADTVTKLGMLSKEDVKDLQFFACGGGSKMEYFRKNLIDDLKTRQPNCSWLYANHRVIPIPDNLIVEGVRQQDYDRLSVAYGLSQLELDSNQGVVWPEPLSPTTYSSKFNKIEFITKDMV